MLCCFVMLALDLAGCAKLRGCHLRMQLMPFAQAGSGIHIFALVSRAVFAGLWIQVVVEEMCANVLRLAFLQDATA